MVKPPAENMWSEVLRLSASLADMATTQVASVSNELKRGATEKDDDIGAGRVDMGAAAASFFQLVGKVGELVTQLSKYDLVRRDTSMLTLGAANPTSSLTTSVDKPIQLAFLLANDGAEAVNVEAEASLTFQPKDVVPGTVGSEPPSRPLGLSDKVNLIGAQERRRIVLEDFTISKPGHYRLRIDVRDSAVPVGKPPSARKTVQILVLPPPGA